MCVWVCYQYFSPPRLAPCCLLLSQALTDLELGMDDAPTLTQSATLKIPHRHHNLHSAPMEGAQPLELSPGVINSEFLHQQLLLN